MSTASDRDTKPYCIAPWTSLYIQHDGGVYPCCHWTRFQPLGNIHHNSVKEIWNSEAYKKLRLQMLDNQSPKSCEDCRFVESTGEKSLRHDYLETQKAHLGRTLQTEPDGTYSNFSPVYVSTAVGIKCQLKCRMCGPTDSSSWQSVIPGNETDGSIVKDVPTENLKTMLTEAEEIERLLFVGGEPIINSLHYEILDLALQKNSQPELFYNSNLVQLEWQKKDIISYWNKFKKVNLFVSIDGDEERFNFIRTGHDYDKLLKNVFEVRRRAPHVKLTAYITVSTYNFLFIPEIVESLLTKGKFASEEILFNFVRRPLPMNPVYAPGHLKQKAKSKYILFIKRLILEKGLNENIRLIRGLRLVLSYFENAHHDSKIYDEFLTFNRRYPPDLRHGTFEKVFKDLLPLETAE